MKLTTLPALVCALLFPLLSTSGRAQTASPAEFASYTTADDLWSCIQQATKAAMTRPENTADYRAFMTKSSWQIYAASVAFQQRYPNDPRKWDARLLQIQHGSIINAMAGHGDKAGEIRQLENLSRDTTAPPSARAAAIHQIIRFSLQAYASHSGSITAANIVAAINQLATDYPTYPQLNGLKYQAAKIFETADPASAQALLASIPKPASNPNAAQPAANAVPAGPSHNPLNLHFTAVDGSPVDLASMRGKVILVDFWATWCGPCRAEIPNVVAAYSKYHDRGFEVVGISLDKDKYTLQSYTEQHSMPWPQYFDGKGWDNEISSSFGIHAIPAMWIVDKNGNVVSTNGRADLDGQVEKLLEE